VDNLPAPPSGEVSLDARIVRITERTVSSILSRTVIPMQNAMIETCSELRRDVNLLREDVDAIKATLYEAAPGTPCGDLQVHQERAGSRGPARDHRHAA
jgi:hypothetical protein